MADLSFSRQPVYLADASNNIAGVINTTPSSEYGIVTRNIPSGTQTVDTELAAAAAIAADAQSAPTAPGVYGWLMGYNGANWDRLRVANTGRLQVDVVTGGGSNASVLVDNAGFTDGTSSLTVLGGYFDEVAGTGLTENDIAAVRIDSKRAMIGVLEDATTRGQRLAVSAAGAASSNLTQVGGVTMSATVPVIARLTDGTAFYAKTGQLLSTAAFAQLSDQTTAVGVIAATTALKTDLSSVAGTATVTANINGVQSVGGPTAADAALTAYPQTIGARASTATPTAMSTDGDVVNVWASLNGALNVTLRDTSGNYVGAGGGTQYVGDAAATATPTGSIQMGLANAAAPTDVTANADAVAAWFLRNGSQVVSLASGGTLIAVGQGAMAASLPVVIASNQSAITVDTEMPAAAALADNTSTPTVPGVGAFLMGFDGTNWDRVGVSATGGRLQVDVISGGGSPAPSELPSGYNALIVYGTTSGTASAATVTVTTNTPANTKPYYVRNVVVSASGATKWQVKFGATVLATGFIPQAALTQSIRFDPPLAGTGDGTTALTIDVTNREASAMDLYARMGAIVLA